MASLGQPIDQTTARIGFLETAIRARLKEGIPPTNAALRALTAELASLQQHAGDFALAESRRELEGWAQVMEALGQPIDQTEASITALETVIRTKLKAAIPPTTATMQALTAELATLKQQADATFAAETIKNFRQQVGDPQQQLEMVFQGINADLFALDNTLQAFGDSSEETAQELAVLEAGLERARALGFTPLDPAVAGLTERIRELKAELADLERARAVEGVRERLRGFGENLEQQFRTPREELEQTRIKLQALQTTFPEYSATVERAQRAANIEFAKTTLLGQGLTLVAAGITDAFAQTFDAIIAGTLSVGDAFKNMAQSIALSISKLLVQKGIELLLGAALSGIGGSAGTGVVPGASGGQTYAPGGGYGLLAPVRTQRGGRVPGAGRGDTVPLLAEPGEFVVRRQAAIALGQPFLRALNTAPEQTLQRLQQQVRETGTPDLQARQRRTREAVSPQIQQVQQQAHAALSPDLLAFFAQLPRFQQGGPGGRHAGGRRARHRAQSPPAHAARSHVDAAEPTSSGHYYAHGDCGTQ